MNSVEALPRSASELFEESLLASLPASPDHLITLASECARDPSSRHHLGPTVRIQAGGQLGDDARRYDILKSETGHWRLVRIPAFRSAPTIKPRSDRTFNWLVDHFLASDKWRGYSKNTQDTHRKSLYGVRRAWGSKPLSFFDDPLVYSELLTWQGTLADTPGSADNFINVLSAVLKFGVNEGLVEENYAAGIPDLFDIRGRAHITWSRENLDRFVACSDRLGMPQVGDAALLAFECGMRPQDLRTAQEVHVQHDVLRKFALKSSPQGRRYYATIPRTADLDAVVARCRSRFRMEGVENLLVTPKGKAWRDFQLENAVRLVRNKAGIRYFDPKTGECEDLHLHDLRGTFATRLILTTDLCDEQIATLMGWSARSVASIRRVYVSDRARIRQIGKLLWTDL